MDGSIANRSPLKTTKPVRVFHKSHNERRGELWRCSPIAPPAVEVVENAPSLKITLRARFSSIRCVPIEMANKTENPISSEPSKPLAHHSNKAHVPLAAELCLSLEADRKRQRTRNFEASRTRTTAHGTEEAATQHDTMRDARWSKAPWTSRREPVPLGIETALKVSKARCRTSLETHLFQSCGRLAHIDCHGVVAVVPPEAGRSGEAAEPCGDHSTQLTDCAGARLSTPFEPSP